MDGDFFIESIRKKMKENPNYTFTVLSRPKRKELVDRGIFYLSDNCDYCNSNGEYCNATAEYYLLDKNNKLTNSLCLEHYFKIMGVK